MKNMMKSKKMWIAFCIVFLSGIAIGIVAGMAVKRSSIKKERKQQGMMKIRLLRHMSDELELTTDQKVSVDEIITGMTDKVTVLHNEQRPKIKNIIDTAFADIDKILTEDQKTKMERLKERMAKSRRMRHNKERGSGRRPSFGNPPCGRAPFGQTQNRQSRQGSETGAYGPNSRMEGERKFRSHDGYKRHRAEEGRRKNDEFIHASPPLINPLQQATQTDQ